MTMNATATKLEPSMDLQHISFKLFVENPAQVNPADFVNVFHAWIRDQKLAGLTMIDVADYTHVPHGPGVMLICYQAHFGMDEGFGRVGLLYANKRGATGTVTERLASALRWTLTAARYLEAESVFAGKLRFRTDELELLISDYYYTPNTAEAYQTLRPEVQALAEGVLGSSQLTHLTDTPKSGLRVMLKPDAPQTLDGLLARV